MEQRGQVCQRLVVQVHADALALVLELLGEAQRPLPQPILAGARFSLDDGRRLACSAERRANM